MFVMELVEIERRIAQLQKHPNSMPNPADQVLKLGEFVLENWLVAKGREPTMETREGFRLLALHRQGTRGDPSFNACRETCRELVFHVNSFKANADSKHIVSSIMVVKHLLLFIKGKLEHSDIGEFCCSSKPLRSTTETKYGGNQ